MSIFDCLQQKFFFIDLGIGKINFWQFYFHQFIFSKAINFFPKNLFLFQYTKNKGFFLFKKNSLFLKTKI
jgi:hypothetical protein